MSNGNKPMSTDDKVQYAVFSNANLTRETIQEWIKRDIESMYCLCAELLSDRALMDGMVNVMYNRYVKYHESKNLTPNEDVR